MEGKKAVYDSGEVTDADSLDYSVNVELKPRTRYQWSVEVTADTKEQVSAESWFETGKTDEVWEGQWIAPEQQTSSVILRKTFVYDGTAKSARLYMCGLGVYECYINGKKAGDEYLAPDVYKRQGIHNGRRSDDIS